MPSKIILMSPSMAMANNCSADIEKGAMAMMANDVNVDVASSTVHNHLHPRKLLMNAVCASILFVLCFSLLMYSIYFFAVTNVSSSTASTVAGKSLVIPPNSNGSLIANWQDCNAVAGDSCAGTGFSCCIGIADLNTSNAFASKTTCRPVYAAGTASSYDFLGCIDPVVMADYATCQSPSLDKCASTGFACCAGLLDFNVTAPLLSKKTCRPSTECAPLAATTTFSSTQPTPVLSSSSSSPSSSSSLPSSSTSNSISAQVSSTLTFYDPTTGGGKCDGIHHAPTELVVAMSSSLLTKYSACHSVVSLTVPFSLKSVDVVVVDECDERDGCTSNNVDGTPAVWQALGLDMKAGRVAINWRVVSWSHDL